MHTKIAHKKRGAIKFGLINSDNLSTPGNRSKKSYGYRKNNIKKSYSYRKNDIKNEAKTIAKIT